MQQHLTPGQLDDRDRHRFRLFNGKQRDPTRQGKRSDTPYFRQGHDRILGPHDFMPVGEHAGKHLRAVPPEFLLWVDQQPWSKTWAPWEAVHSYIERYILSDPETAAGIALPVGPVIFLTPGGILHTLPGFEDMLHAYAVGALNLRTTAYQRGTPPHYALTERQIAAARKKHATVVSRDEFEHHKTQWRTHFQTRRQFVPENDSNAATRCGQVTPVEAAKPAPTKIMNTTDCPTELAAVPSSPPVLDWTTDEVDDSGNTIWEAPSPYTDECGSPEYYFRIKQRLQDDKHEFVEASDYEVNLCPEDPRCWPTLAEAQAAMAQDYADIVRDCASEANATLSHEEGRKEQL